MESRTIPIEYKNSPFDKSIESIESTKVYGAVLLRRYYLSLANEMQQSNGKLLGRKYVSVANEMQWSNGKQDYSDRI